MVATLRPALVLIVLFTILTGIALPLAFTGGAAAIAPTLAEGSLITLRGKIIGSSLVGQNFVADRYFHPRPSATSAPDPKDSTKTVSAPYNAANSSGSNLAPTSKALLDRVKGDVPNSGPRPVPGDMVTSSASGLDPDISPENAARQIARVAAARRLSPEAVRHLVEANTQPRLLGLIGEPHVNVLRLNLALDGAR